ncbi:MAG: Eco57I restriction-modification methylase domain-containing protein [Pyrinomonadaceae bacterium]
MNQLFREPIPSVCNRAIDAEKFAERALDFRILDPSMESGQLLLEIALACIRRVESRHSPASKTGQRLIQVMLKKLCADCLFGVDKNALALPSARLVFSLLGAEYGIRRLTPYHLFTADSLRYEQFAEFDGVINNPPWGDVTNAVERRLLRKRFETIDSWVDTYLPFTELDIRCLRPGGALALIIPSQVIAMRHAARLREMILNKIQVDQIILLPRAAFVDATVRAAMILGSARGDKVVSGMCRVITYPFEKRIESIAPVRTFDISQRALNRAGRHSWSPLLNGNGEHGAMSKTVELGHLASFKSGIQVYVRHAGEPPQTAQVVREHPFTFVRPAKGRIPVIRGREVQSYLARADLA